MATSKRAKSYVLLNESEREWLDEEGYLSAKQKSDLRKKLDEKFPQLLDDIKLIFDSGKLDVWVDRKISQGFPFWEFQDLFEELNTLRNPRITYISKFRAITTGKITKYWLESITWDQLNRELENKKLKTKNLYYDEKIYHPSFMLRELKPREKTRILILKLWKKNPSKFPCNSKDAFSLKEIKKKLKT